jgi:two-component system, OmpR family, phosphate regulon sensor histidine kinase PhoR
MKDPANLHAQPTVAVAAQSVDAAPSIDPAVASGWIAAFAIALAWALLSARRRRSERRLEEGLLADDTALREEDSYPGVDRLASAVTRRVRVERERDARSREQLGEIERILRSTPIAVIALDHKQRVISANPAAERLLGISEAVVRGRLLQESVREPGLNRLISDALSDGGRRESEIHLELDAAIEVQVCCEPLQSEAQPPGLVVSLVDVTRMRRLESMRSEFASNVSHELRTPITNIKGYVETLLQVGVDDPAQMRKFLEIVHRNTVRLSGIVEDILTLAYLEEPGSRTGLESEEVAVSDLVRQVVEDLGPTASAKSMRIDFPPEDGTLAVLVNRSLALQALANLVSNAVKYSTEGTQVAIRCGMRDGLVRIAVSDQGPGIAAKHLPRVFERFYRVDKARARTQGGTGLGLAIVKHIASIHGGRVEVESQVGQGSTFALLLPPAPRA